MKRNSIVCLRTTKIAFTLGLSLLFGSFSVHRARGQFDMLPGMMGFTSTGTASETVKPKSLRLVMQVTAKGKDPKKAIEALATKKGELKKALEEMRANVSSMAYSDANLTQQIAGSGTDSSSSTELQMMMQMQRQMAGGSGSAEAALDVAELPTSFTSSCQLKVDWDLPENVDSDVISLLKSRLEEEVKKRDLMKAGGSVDLSEEEKETLELFESQTQGGYSGYSRSGQAFSSKIFLVGMVSEELIAKLSKQAFEKAVDRATKISAATGIKKGDIVGVSFSSNESDLMNSYRYIPQNYMYDDQVPDTTFLVPGENEVMGSKPSDLKKAVSIAVLHEIVK